MNFTEQLPPHRVAEFSNSVHRFVQLQAQKARLDAEILEVLGDISVVIDEAVDSGPQDSRIMDQAQRALCLEVGAPARMHEQAILTMVNNARPFVRDSPKTLQALAAAEISQRHAFIITDLLLTGHTAAHRPKPTPNSTTGCASNDELFPADQAITDCPDCVATGTPRAKKSNV